MFANPAHSASESQRPEWNKKVITWGSFSGLRSSNSEQGLLWKREPTAGRPGTEDAQTHQGATQLLGRESGRGALREGLEAFTFHLQTQREKMGSGR